VRLRGQGGALLGEGVVLGAAGAHVHDGSVDEDRVVDADLKEKPGRL